jgi:hypothetical protein
MDALEKVSVIVRDAVVRSKMRSGPGLHRTEPRVWFGSGSRSGLFPFFHQGPVQGSCKAGYVVDPVRTEPHPGPDRDPILVAYNLTYNEKRPRKTACAANDSNRDT